MKNKIYRRGKTDDEKSQLSGMSDELLQNARQTMGELRDLMRETGLTWEFIEREIDRANRKPTGLERAMEAMDPYSTGIGRSLKGLAGNLQ